MNNKMSILITTPDYFPKLGGLTTFTDNLMRTLQSLGHKTTLMVWEQVSEVKDYNIPEEITLILNVHFMGGCFLDNSRNIPYVNFCHGSEILLKSPNPIKTLIKRFMRARFIEYFESAKHNVFVSQFTLDKFLDVGVKYDMNREIVIHNCINTGDKLSIQKKTLSDGEIRIVCIARDVPHKNLDGAIRFVQLLSKCSDRRVKLFITRDFSQDDSNVQIVSVKGIDNISLDKLYQDAHFNLLLSKDHSHKGFYFKRCKFHNCNSAGQ
jgi:glycosyltransferase involved in cell wall biosynthesis